MGHETGPAFVGELRVSVGIYADGIYHVQCRAELKDGSKRRITRLADDGDVWAAVAKTVELWRSSADADYFDVEPDPNDRVVMTPPSTLNLSPEATKRLQEIYDKAVKDE